MGGGGGRGRGKGNEGRLRAKLIVIGEKVTESAYTCVENQNQKAKEKTRKGRGSKPSKYQAALMRGFVEEAVDCR